MINLQTDSFTSWCLCHFASFTRSTSRCSWPLPSFLRCGWYTDLWEGSTIFHEEENGKVCNYSPCSACKECRYTASLWWMWRLVYSIKKLTTPQHNQLMSAFEELSFSCGAPLEEMDLPEEFPVIFVKKLSCSDPTEKLYYSVGHKSTVVQERNSLTNHPIFTIPSAPLVEVWQKYKNMESKDLFTYSLFTLCMYDITKSFWFFFVFYSSP